MLCGTFDIIDVFPFSFNVATAHVISVDTEVYINTEMSDATVATQFHWLVNDLQVSNNLHKLLSTERET